jgi:hypothetical protein
MEERGGEEEWAVQGEDEVRPAGAGAVGVLGPTAQPGLPLKVFLGVGRCRRL